MSEKAPLLFGHELGRRFGDAAPQTLLINSNISATMGITRIQSDHGTRGWTEPPTREKGFIIPVYLKAQNTSGWATSIDGTIHEVSSWEAGGTAIYDLESNLSVIRNGAVDVIHFNIPRATLDAFTQDAELPTVSQLTCVEGQRDDILFHLAQMNIPNIARQQVLPTLFLEYFIQVFCSRIVSNYSTVQATAPVHRGGLAPWQKRRTLEVLEQHLSGDLRLERLASESGLSSSYFSRCFRKSFGVSVHQFVIQKRVERARDLLLQAKSSLADIAIEAGFSDQAAFSRTFSGAVGLPPARWKAMHLAKSRIAASRMTATPAAFLRPQTAFQTYA